MELSANERIGFGHWFIEYRHIPAVQRFCLAGHATKWVDAVERTLNLNLSQKSSLPNSWPQLAKAIGLRDHGFATYTLSDDSIQNSDSSRTPDRILRHQVACALKCDDRQLSPGTAEWVASVSQLMVAATHRDPNNSFSESIYLRYGELVFSGLSSIVNLDLTAPENLNFNKVRHLAALIASIIKELEGTP